MRTWACCASVQGVVMCIFNVYFCTLEMSIIIRAGILNLTGCDLFHGGCSKVVCSIFKNCIINIKVVFLQRFFSNEKSEVGIQQFSNGSPAWSNFRTNSKPTNPNLQDLSNSLWTICQGCSAISKKYIQIAHYFPGKLFFQSRLAGRLNRPICMR